MSFRFDPEQGLVIVRAELGGPTGTAILRLALDTGATATVMSVEMLVSVGYDPAIVPDRSQITTGSGIEFAARIPVITLKALGEERKAFAVLAHTLPPSAGVDGLLGVDFLRHRTLTINFHQGLITLQ